MTDSFQTVMRKAAPGPEDLAAIRRLNRSLMKERFRSEHRGGTDHLRTSFAAFGLALLVLVVSQVEIVGSDDWLLEKDPLTSLDGREKATFSRPLTGGAVAGLESMTEGQAQGILISTMVKDFKTLHVQGLEIHGRTYWSRIVETHLEGKSVVMGITVKDPASRHTPDHDRVLTSDLYQKILVARNTPPDSENATVTLESVTYAVKTWVFPSTVFGTVKYHLGMPIR